MRRCNSLPQVACFSPKEEKAKTLGHVHFLPRAKVSLSRVKYKGRYSLNKAGRGKGEDGPMAERSRHSSGTLQNGHAHHALSFCLDDDSSPYDSIPSEHVSAKECAMRFVPTAVAPSFAACDWSASISNRNSFYNKLVKLSSANFSVASRVLAEPLTSETKKDHQGELYLMTIRNEKHKRGDLLWLTFQAMLAGRRMKTWREQLNSLRIHDAYIKERRQREFCVLEDIRQFHLGDMDQRVHSEGHLLPFKDVHTDSMKIKLHTVRSLLDRLDSFESLFPSLTYMMRLVDFDKQLLDRIALLNMWYKTTMNLYDCIREVGCILGVSDSSHRSSTLSPSSTISECLTPSSLSWPSLEGPFAEERIDGDRKLSAAGAISGCSSHSVRSSTSSDLPALLGQPPRIYTAFVSKSLRLKGMRRVLERLENVCAVTISKAVILLQKPPGSYAEAARTAKSESNRYLPITADYFPSMMLDGLSDYRMREKQKEKYSVHHEEFIAMGLPSFIKLFHFLVRVPLDLVDEWLKMRGGMQLNSDLLTLQTVMEDCHDCLRAAISVKHTYVALAQLVGLDNKELLENLADFENHLSDLFKNYLTCVRQWASAELSSGACAVWGDRFLSELVKEWKLAKRFAVNVICGEKDVAHRFCVIGMDLLRKMVINYFSDAEGVMEERRSEFNVPYGMNAEMDVRSKKIPSRIHVACRHFRELVKELRNRALRALSFTRSIIFDLEKCALYEFKSSAQNVLYQLYLTAHVLVFIPHVADKYAIFCDKNAVEDADFVRVLLNITCARQEEELPAHIAKRTGYLVIFPLTSLNCFSSEGWRGGRIQVDLDADTEMFLHFLQIPSDACLVASNGQQLAHARRVFDEDVKGGRQNLLSIVEEQFSCHEGIAELVCQLKEEAARTYQVIWTGLVEQMVDAILDERSLISLDFKEVETMRDTLFQAYWLTFEYRRELLRLLPRSSRKSFAEETVEWINHWLSFVTSFRGDGAKHWASQSLKFLTFAADPQLTSFLSDDKYKELVSMITECIERTIGGSSQGFGSPQDSLDDHEEPYYDESRRRAASVGDMQVLFDARLERIRTSVVHIDEQRDKLLREQEKIGSVRPYVRSGLSLTTLYGVKKRAPFEWRRTDNKIGKGKFGTVYIVINLTEPGLMAMKQISFDGNHKAVHALIDEVENLRTLDHPNIVKYFAIEVHREELLIFMEYCPGGTLEAKCRENIEMPRVRRYTYFLLKAVEYIHERMIVHRDIKPANIFIGRGHVLKLGDFGSSVHLRGGQTSFGEIVQLAGTPAYMAPEVQTLGGKVDVNGKEEIYGYGRAADIWSVGCVVLEMCTGKPPWHELEMLQIIFRVGTGMRPPIPPKMQADEECISFLDMCFQSNPGLRANAGQLIQHPFANIPEDEKDVEAEAGSF